MYTHSLFLLCNCRTFIGKLKIEGGSYLVLGSDNVFVIYNKVYMSAASVWRVAYTFVDWSVIACVVLCVSNCRCAVVLFASVNVHFYLELVLSNCSTLNSV